MITTTIAEKACYVRFDYRPEYLFASIEGDEGDLDARRRLWQMIAAEYKTKRYERILVVENCSEVLSTADVFQLASEIPSMGFAGGRSAYVDANLANSEIVEFGETVAINRGMNCAVFSTVEDAEKWLMK